MKFVKQNCCNSIVEAFLGTDILKLSFHLCHAFTGIKDEKFSILLGNDALNSCHYCYFIPLWNIPKTFSNFLYQLHNPLLSVPSSSCLGNFSDQHVLRAAWTFG